MQPDWIEQATTWWSRAADLLVADSVRREKLAGALSGRPLSTQQAVDRLLSHIPINPRNPFEERARAAVMIEDARGGIMPLTERVRLIRRITGLPWSEVAQRIRAANMCSEAELDQLLSEAGATVRDRLLAQGLVRT